MFDGNTLYKFSVLGSGEFPVGLLAKYKCFPSSGENASLIAKESFRSRRIKLQGLMRPNKKVWLSYGWVVTGIAEEQECDYDNYHTWPA
jgi:hypothetical protein